MNRVLLRALLELSRSLQLETKLSPESHEAAEQLEVICNVLLIGES